ncbi:flavin reductase family protein [Streptacidiphilus carbonis]|jgi:flavin reductase ActVB|uniref:flavin reductase family protein n=1 Tax=Streptacidiphilus carbonis TaxID=105422 RepID=UPI0005A6FBAD|nr:flavin reductase family protein [Streptacidiphilus carbonis]
MTVGQTLERRAVEVDADRFREAMARLAAPVVVVTTRYGERDWGMTASAVMSVSLDPPLVTVGIARTAGCHRALTRAPEFVINVLGDRQQDLARRFAGRGVDRFAGGGTDALPGSGLPVVRGAGVVCRCERWDVVTVGDHDLLIGRPVAIELAETAGDPLLWYRRSFGRAAPAPM